ncbi:unnamed protein product [Pieris macdunnoughi]|uniref:Uncharacterized protein n=1 Tax=Pieris macdunnoughi TaxID=345717 RepID=A0A821L9J7_9NEOP|nr:unnamed protein product [Pieris macdunnoughi]
MPSNQVNGQKYYDRKMSVFMLVPAQIPSKPYRHIHIWYDSVGFHYPYKATLDLPYKKRQGTMSLEVQIFG